MHHKKCYDPKLKFRIDESRIIKDLVVTLSTIPPRIEKIWPTINSILLQTALPSKIYVWIPKQYKRFNNASIKKIPDFLMAHPLIEVNLIDEDYGPATKLLPCLKMDLKPETKIVVVDDDKLYKPKLIQLLDNFSTKKQNAAITINGTNIITSNKKRSFKGKRPHTKKVNILHGNGGYLVRQKFFSQSIFTHPHDYPELFYHDDVWISGNLHQTNTKIYITPNNWTKSCKQSKLLKKRKISTYALCKNENRDRRTFFNAWNYFVKPGKSNEYL